MKTIQESIAALISESDIIRNQEQTLRVAINGHSKNTQERMYFAAFGFIAPYLRQDQIMVVNTSSIEIKRKEDKYFTTDFQFYLNENYGRFASDGDKSDSNNFRSISICCSSVNTDKVEEITRLVTVGKFAEMLATQGELLLQALNDAHSRNADELSELYTKLYALERERGEMSREIQRMTIDARFDKACKDGIGLVNAAWDVTQYLNFRRITKVNLVPTSSGKTCRVTIEYLTETWKEGVGYTDKTTSWNGNVSTEKVRSFLSSLNADKIIS